MGRARRRSQQLMVSVTLNIKCNFRFYYITRIVQAHTVECYLKTKWIICERVTKSIVNEYVLYLKNAANDNIRADNGNITGHLRLGIIQTCTRWGLTRRSCVRHDTMRCAQIRVDVRRMNVFLVEERVQTSSRLIRHSQTRSICRSRQAHPQLRHSVVGGSGK